MSPPARRLPLLVLLVVLLATACGLPLPGGVQRPGAVPAEQRRPEPISVLPPGPQPGATPQAVVLGFLTAQSSARDRHGIARGFLDPDERDRWRDDAGVTVYDPRTATTSRPVVQGDAVVVTLQLDVLGEVAADGAARVQAPTPSAQVYRLRQGADRQWRLVEVPDGLTLTPTARDRSYDAFSVHFLAPLGPPPSARHLVADLVQLPVDGDPAQQCVEHLLAGPSSGLAGSVETAVPAGAALRRPVTTSAAGEVTVDLTGPADAYPSASRADLSAQLVWTLRDALPDFTRLSLLVDGRVLQVPGVGQPQPRGAWSGYAPDGPLERPPGLALVGGALRTLEPVVEDRPPTAVADVSRVVDQAVDARTGRLAVLTDDGDTRTLRVGPLAGPLTAVLRDPGLRSPTWGSGDGGVYVLRTGGARAGVLLVPPTPAAVPVEVAVTGGPALDASSVLRVSRDGVRVALVSGGVLQVGRLEQGTGPRLVALRALSTGVRDVAWRTGTLLDVLVQDDEPPLLPLLALSVDGTSAVAGGLVGVAEGRPVALAAFGAQPLLVEVDSDRSTTVYSGDGTTGFQVQLPDASRPAYPR